MDPPAARQERSSMERHFKAVQREQIKSDDIVLATDKKLLEDKSFSKLHDVKVAEHAA